ncbi:MAG: hypothetical protein KBD46_01190 [Candidatus Levybacteria bacterium]|nr:hypothetical protein [Candidatus Levybacteria bacterium]
MLIGLLVILIVLWALGFLPTDINIPNITFFVFNGRPITLIDLVVFGVIGWIVELLPSPFRLIASILLILWVLSVLGILAFTGLSQWLVLTIIVGLVFYIIRGVFSRTPTD